MKFIVFVFAALVCCGSAYAGGHGQAVVQQQLVQPQKVVVQPQRVVVQPQYVAIPQQVVVQQQVQNYAVPQQVQVQQLVQPQYVVVQQQLAPQRVVVASPYGVVQQLNVQQLNSHHAQAQVQRIVVQPQRVVVHDQPQGLFERLRGGGRQVTVSRSFQRTVSR